jgi:glutathione S-transferase
MYKLYYSPGACSMAIHVAVLECQQQVTLEKVDLQAPRSPEFLKVNPRGQVPVLVDGDQVLREGAAILIYLMEKHQCALLPASGKARADAIEWLMFCNSTLHPAYGRCFFLRKAAEEGPVKNKLLEIAVGKVNELWQGIEAQLSKQSYLCGNEATIADILLTVIANWSGNIGGQANIGPNTKKLFAKIIARPAYAKALQTEQVEYKMAA